MSKDHFIPKFYLKGLESAEPICWRVEAVDSISMPNILAIKAQEYYVNKDQDDVNNNHLFKT